MDSVIYFIVLNIIGILLMPFLKVRRDVLYFLPAVMAGIGLAGAVWKGIQAAKQNSLANGINPNDPTYEISPYAKANLGMAQSLYNGRMAGATDLERNIQANQATTLGSVNRNATNSAQALALAGAAQGQTNAALSGLQVNEAQNKYALAGQVANANRDLTTEQGKVYQDQLRKYEQDVQAKSALRQAAANNLSGLFGDLTSGAMLASSMGGLGGGAGNMGFGNINTANIAGSMPLAGMINTSAALNNFGQPSMQTPTPQISAQNGMVSPGGYFFNPFARR